MHRHQYSGRKFSREAGPRKALFRNLVSQVILHETVTTTLEKAKEIRPILEKLITRAKSGTLSDRRVVEKFLSFNDKSAEKLFSELGELYKDRQGGYTRILKLPNRVGDNAKMAMISLLDTEKLTKKAIKEDKAKKPEKKVTPKVDPKKPVSKVAKKVTKEKK
jgi:large subunit ribosomal protein L17